MDIPRAAWMLSPAFCLFSVLWISTPVRAAGQASDRDLVRVRLTSSNAEFEFNAREIEITKDATSLFRADSKTPLALRLRVRKNPKSEEFLLTLMQGKKLLTELPLGRLLPLQIEVSRGHLGAKQLPPQMILDQVQGVIELRAEVAFSEYLLGVLSREMPGAWPMEALKAQAIATRSYTLSQMNSRSDWSYDLEGSVLDQDFEWVGADKRKLPALIRWQQALEATRNQFLTGSKGEVFRAYYHADCGGRTTTPDFVWGPTGDYKSVRDPSCETRAKNRWKLVASKDWIRNQLQPRQQPREQVRGIASTTVSKAGLEFSWIQSLFDQRVTLVEWWDGLAELQILSGQNFRQLLGFGKLKSLRFSTREQGGNLVFEGRGFGHGVGLCQWGSRDWAEQGMDHVGILQHYYPLARLVTGELPKAKVSGLGGNSAIR